MAAASSGLVSDNWAGGIIPAAAGKSFSSVTAQWVVPTVTQTPQAGVSLSDAAVWVGLDGSAAAAGGQSPDVCQAGITGLVTTAANGASTVTYQAWDEWYPAASNSIPASDLTINPGDTIKVTVDTLGVGSTNATFIYDDETTKQTYATSLTAPQGTSLLGNTAEYIVESNRPYLSDFYGSPVSFQDIGATYAGGTPASLATAVPISIVKHDTLNGSGSIQTASNMVTVNENNYWV